MSSAVSTFNDAMRAIVRDAARVGRREVFVDALHRFAAKSPVVRTLFENVEPAADGAFDVARVESNARRLKESDPLPSVARALCECVVFVATELQDVLRREVNDHVVGKMAELADIASRALPISQRPTAAAPPMSEATAADLIEEPPPPPPNQPEVTAPSSTRIAARPPAPESSGRIAVPRAPSVPKLRANPPPPRARLAAKVSPFAAPKPVEPPPPRPPPPPPAPPVEATPPAKAIEEPSPPPPPPVAFEPLPLPTPPSPIVAEPVVVPEPAIVAAPEPAAKRRSRGAVLLASALVTVLLVVIAFAVVRGTNPSDAVPPKSSPKAAANAHPAPSAKPAASEPAIAATAAAPPPSSGTLVTSPESAGHRVYVDGKLIGDAPQRIELSCGEHAVRVGSKGSLQKVSVPCGEEIVVGLR